MEANFLEFNFKYHIPFSLFSHLKMESLMDFFIIPESCIMELKSTFRHLLNLSENWQLRTNIGRESKIIEFMRLITAVLVRTSLAKNVKIILRAQNKLFLKICTGYNFLLY